MLQTEKTLMFDIEEKGTLKETLDWVTEKVVELTNEYLVTRVLIEEMRLTVKGVPLKTEGKKPILTPDEANEVNQLVDDKIKEILARREKPLDPVQENQN